VCLHHITVIGLYAALLFPEFIEMFINEINDAEITQTVPSIDGPDSEIKLA